MKHAHSSSWKIAFLCTKKRDDTIKGNLSGPITCIVLRLSWLIISDSPCYK